MNFKQKGKKIWKKFQTFFKLFFVAQNHKMAAGKFTNLMPEIESRNIWITNYEITNVRIPCSSHFQYQGYNLFVLAWCVGVIIFIGWCVVWILNITRCNLNSINFTISIKFTSIKHVANMFTSWSVSSTTPSFWSLKIEKYIKISYSIRVFGS